MKGIIPRVAASNIQIQTAALAVLKVCFMDQQSTVFNLPQWLNQSIAKRSHHARSASAGIFFT